MAVKSTLTTLFSGTDDELQILTDDAENPIEYDLGDDRTLEVHGSPESATHPVQFRVVEYPDEYRSVTMAAIDPPAGIFDPENDAVLERYATLVESLTDSDGAETFRDVVDEIGEAYRDGTLVVLDEGLSALVKSTHSVEYNPEARNPWIVTLTDEHTLNNDWGIKSVGISGETWASETPRGVDLPIGFGVRLSKSTECWRQLRYIWSMMYARNCGFDGE